MKGQRAKKIKWVRGYLGMTQAEFAKDLGVR